MSRSAIALFALTSSMYVAQRQFTLQPVHAFELTGLGAPALIRTIANQTGVHIGLEADVVMGTEEKLAISFAGGTVTDLAQACIKLLGGGSWSTLTDRTILIQAGRKATSFGTQRLSIPMMKAGTRQQVWSALWDSTSTQTWLREEHCGQSALLRGWEWHGDKHVIDLAGSEATIASLLESAAYASGISYWQILDNSASGGCEISMTLW